MKRKYYMRGLGLGIIFTSILFMIGIALGNPMSDAAVRRRARQLGMVEADTASGDADSRTLKEIQDEEEKKNSSKASSTSSSSTTVTTDPKTGQKTTTTTTTKQHASGDKPDDGKAFDDQQKQDDKKEKTDGTKKVSKTTTKPSNSKISVSISSGDTSDDVGKKLQSAGIVDSGSDFNHYLEQHGYDRTIHSGTYTFEKGSSYSSIAGKISG